MSAPIGAEDLYRFRWIDHVRLSRDGERIAYQLGWADAESRQNRSRVVVRRVLEAEPIEPTGAPRRDHSPEWSPDGHRLAFISKAGPADQLFVLDIAGGGETRQLTWVPEGVANPLWSPDGTRIAFTGSVLSDPEAVVDDPRPPEARDQLRRTPVARVVRRLDHKHDGQGFVDGRYHHLFVVSAQGGGVSQLTSGAWDVTGFDWSPDGNRLVVSGNAEPGADLQRELNLYIVDLAGSLHRFGGGLNLGSPAWSPRGDLIAFIAPNGTEAGYLERLWVVPLTGEGPRCLTAHFDQAVTDSLITDMRAGHGSRLSWSPNGERIYFLASGPGVTGLYSSDLEGNVNQEAGGQRRIFDFDVSSGVVAFAASDYRQPGELHILTQGAEARLTDLNPWLHDRYVAQPERHEFTAPDGWVLEGWVLKPEVLDPAKVHPTVLEVHGGPHGQYGWAFFHELQILAGKGYVVLCVNPRGSDGYGERFRREVVRDWGGKDYVDLMSALDQLIERTGYVDTNRLGIGGGSYGGYMTNWAIGQTNRFSAAVAMRSISNLVSEYSQHDIVLWGVLELGPPPYPDLDELWRRSPIRYVQNIRTPLLLTCGEMDLRCAISQSEEMFGAMRLLGKTVELVRFPEESHDLSRNGRPDRRVERLRRIAGWYERFLGTAAVERVPEAETQVLPIQAFAAPEAPVEEPMPAEPVEAFQPPSQAEAPVASAALELETLALPTLAPAELVTGLHTPAELADPEALPDLPVPGTVAEAADLQTAALNPVLPMSGEGEGVEGESGPEREPAAEPEPEPAVEPEPAPAEEPEPEPEPLVAEVEPEVAPERAPELLAAEAQPEPDIAETELDAVDEPEPLPEAVDEPLPEPEPVRDFEPAPALGEASEPWLQAEQDSDPGRQPEPEAQPAAGGVESEAQPEPEPVVAVEETPAEMEAQPALMAAEPEPFFQATPAEPEPEPEPEPAVMAAEPIADSAQVTRPPVSEPDPIRTTMLRWPGSTSPGNGSPAPSLQPETFEEATSIIPAWQHSEAPADSRRTVSLQAVPVEQITAGAGFAAVLTFESGPFAGRIVALPNQMVTFGRAPDNDVVVGDPATSGHHGRVEVRGGAFWISDLGSTNGTLVNGEPVIEKQLTDGDIIAIGQNTMRFTVEG